MLSGDMGVRPRLWAKEIYFWDREMAQQLRVLVAWPWMLEDPASKVTTVSTVPWNPASVDTRPAGKSHPRGMQTLIHIKLSKCFREDSELQTFELVLNKLRLCVVGYWDGIGVIHM